MVYGESRLFGEEVMEGLYDLIGEYLPLSFPLCFMKGGETMGDQTSFQDRLESSVYICCVPALLQST